MYKHLFFRPQILSHIIYIEYMYTKFIIEFQIKVKEFTNPLKWW